MDDVTLVRPFILFDRFLEIYAAESRLAVSKQLGMLLSNFQRSLAAVIVGNLIYFALFPVLPQVLHHRFSDFAAGKLRISMGRFDWGMLLDFLICAVLYILLGLVWPAKKQQDPRPHP